MHGLVPLVLVLLRLERAAVEDAVEDAAEEGGVADDLVCCVGGGSLIGERAMGVESPWSACMSMFS